MTYVHIILPCWRYVYTFILAIWPHRSLPSQVRVTTSCLATPYHPKAILICYQSTFCDTIWHHRSWSIWLQVITSCHTTPGEYVTIVLGVIHQDDSCAKTAWFLFTEIIKKTIVYLPWQPRLKFQRTASLGSPFTKLYHIVIQKDIFFNNFNNESPEWKQIRLQHQISVSVEAHIPSLRVYGSPV